MNTMTVKICRMESLETKQTNITVMSSYLTILRQTSYYAIIQSNVQFSVN